jgi:hypothetical protein
VSEESSKRTLRCHVCGEWAVLDIYGEDDTDFDRFVREHVHGEKGGFDVAPAEFSARLEKEQE